MLRGIYRHGRYPELKETNQGDLEDRLKNLEKMGITKEMIRKYPSILAHDSTTILARRKLYDFLSPGEKQENEEMQFLCQNDRKFEEQWGKVAREQIELVNPELFEKFFKKGVENYTPEERKVRTGLLINRAFTSEEERTETVEYMFNSTGFTLEELHNKFKEILPKGSKTKKAKEIDGNEAEEKVSPQNEGNKRARPIRDSDRIADEETFWNELQLRLGNEAQLKMIAYSKSGKPKEVEGEVGKSVTKYVLIEVGDYTIMDAIGQAGNAVYIIPNEYVEFLPTKSEIIEHKIGFKKNHKLAITEENEIVYDYANGELFTIIDSIKEFQQPGGELRHKEDVKKESQRLLEQGIVTQENFRKSPVLSGYLSEKRRLETLQDKVSKDLEELRKENNKKLKADMSGRD